MTLFLVLAEFTLALFLVFSNKIGYVKFIPFTKIFDAFKKVFFLLSLLSLFFLNSCVLNDKLVYCKEGILIRGRRSTGLSWFFIPVKATSNYHSYYSVRINYREKENIQKKLLDINIIFLDAKINLGSLHYEDVINISTHTATNCTKTIQKYSRDWAEEKGTTIRFSFFDIKNNVDSEIFFDFDQYNAIKGIDFFSKHNQKSDLFKLEKVGIIGNYSLPLTEKELIFLFGDDAIIQVLHQW